MRVVSLVPSITQTLFALGLGTDEVVGRTAWCIHPRDRIDQVKVVGGTKTPKLRQIQKLTPDLVIMEREENTRESFAEFEAARLAVWVCHVRTVADALAMVRDLGDVVHRRDEAARLVSEIERERDLCQAADYAPLRAWPLIWNQPLMAIGSRRYGADVLRLAGFEVPPLKHDATGYPTLTPNDIGASGARWLLLSSEPHPFTQDQGEVVARRVAAEGFAPPRVRMVDGEALTWFGATTAHGLRYFLELRRELAAAG